MHDPSELHVLEERLLQANFRHHRENVAGLLADDFREFGSSGRAWNKQQILERLEAEPPFEAVTQHLHTTQLAPGAALVTYEVTIDGRVSLRSSVWIQRDSRWQMLFHQGTLMKRCP